MSFIVCAAPPEMPRADNRPRMPRADQKPAVDAPGVPRSPIANPDLHLRLAAQFVATRGQHGMFREVDKPYIRFLSFWGTPPEKLPARRALLNCWVQQMSFNPNVTNLKEVPGGKGRLVWLDLRWFHWNAEGWQAVAERDFFLAEPWIDHTHAEYLRKELCAPLSAQAQKGRKIAQGAGRVQTALILPAVSMMTAEQFLRDTFETERVSSYYDLLFSRERFPGGKGEGGKEVLDLPAGRKFIKRVGADWYFLKDGDPVPQVQVYEFLPSSPGSDTGKYVPYQPQTRREGGKEFVDFPRDLADWEKAFLVDRIRDGFRSKKIDLDFGAIVEGGNDTPDGSLVALHNRLLVNIQGPLGLHMETFDVKETSGIRDFVESTIYGGKPFKPGQGVKAVRDAGEILSYLPNGGQAGLLVDGANKRAEFAGNDIAVQEASTTRDKRVRNIASCFECHAATGGLILPSDTINRFMRLGGELKFKDESQYQRTQAFFRNYARRVKGTQEAYLELVEETTKGYTGAEGWTGAELAKQIGLFRRQYDAPLSLAECAREVGVPEEVMVDLLKRLPFGRSKLLLRGVPVPRRTWEKDLYPNVQILRESLTKEGKYHVP